MSTAYQRALVLSSAALLAGMVTLSTYFLRIPVPFLSQAYVHPGDGVILLCAYMLSPKKAAAAAAAGSFFADILASAFIYAIPTLLIKGAAGFAAGLIFKRSQYSKKLLGIILPAVLVAAIVLAGYFIYECFIYGIRTAAATVLFRLLQSAAGIAAGMILIPVCGRVLPESKKQLLRK